ncbi:MAG: large conductance mechanosensitive channel protein MscL [Ruminococcaceae bacterium]|nr:large conductance mechanosensitive channel protein MscL [Oscillospiraceae bacterium]
MKKFFSEFKKFITRGNVLDMAVGVIVGGAFTAIVNAMSNNILKPVINWVLAKLLGANALSELFTYLKTYLTPEGGVDLTQSIYIDWGAFINAVINFILTAFVLFCIVKTMNSLKENNDRLANELFDGLTKEDRKELKKRKIKLKDKEAVAEYLAEKAKKAEEEKLAAEEKARLEREANPTTEDLLKAILAELQNKQ